MTNEETTNVETSGAPEGIRNLQPKPGGGLGSAEAKPSEAPENKNGSGSEAKPREPEARDEAEVAKEEKKRERDPDYALREPTIGDLIQMSGAIARGSESTAFAAGVDSGSDSGMLYGLLLGALGDAQAKEDFMMGLAQMWQRPAHFPPIPDGEPHDEWGYNPSPKAVDSGQVISREIMWMTMKRSTRVAIYKRWELEALPARKLRDMWESVADHVDLNDFLGTVRERIKERSGESKTE